MAWLMDKRKPAMKEENKQGKETNQHRALGRLITEGR